jgi:hypothetical protein
MSTLIFRKENGNEIENPPIGYTKLYLDEIDDKLKLKFEDGTNIVISDSTGNMTYTNSAIMDVNDIGASKILIPRNTGYIFVLLTLDIICIGSDGTPTNDGILEISNIGDNQTLQINAEETIGSRNSVDKSTFSDKTIDVNSDVTVEVVEASTMSNNVNIVSITGFYAPII